MTSVAIIDYGRGNVRSVFNALDYVGADAVVTDDPAEISNASHVILPGVGAFGDAVAEIRARGLSEVLHREVSEIGKPFLGICVGMQVLATTGYEHGEHSGLGWIDADVRRIDPGPDSLKIPHMGWNQVDLESEHPLFAGFNLDDLVFYFVHSYAVNTLDKHKVLGTCSYGAPFICSLAWDNIVTTQFHPEKSQDSGLEVLKNFISWNP
ncbi:MAG: imidazole glycerol phosphate synthase subunit HisH [Rhodospirillaceae bacterium]